MQLTVLGSSSKGNGYILSNDTESLVIECGARFSDVQKALDFNISSIKGAVVSHEHGDHSRYIEQYLRMGIPVYTSQGTIDGIKFKQIRRPKVISHGRKFMVGNFKVMPFDVQHDCREPLGFLVFHPEMGKLIFLTDTFYSDYVFKQLNHILCEVNYSDEILNENIKGGKVHPSQRKRLTTSHMSLKTAKQLLSANDLSSVNNIVLLHLSDRNSNAGQFKQEITAHTGKPVYVAQKGLIININKEGA
ncbi:MBL fold metallo-hydrolase [Sunxiuqinia indica]|uniref:MBL fold metallo-hydrolase n=1 Tax=Sunxiuqinia indica TaxID=2692584 RepID=UPI00135C8C35|nr:MBL fold metallo-hydrolase [Sunxiuqinia indica]